MAEAAAAAPGWDELKRLAAARAAALGVPDPKRSEDWRYVDVAPLAKPLEKRAAEPFREPPAQMNTVVLQDGAMGASFDGQGGLQIDNLCVHADGAAWRARWALEIDGLDDLSACWSLADLDPTRGAMRIRAGGTGNALQVLALANGGNSGGRLVIEVAPKGELRLVLCHVELAPSRAALAIDVIVGAGGRLVVDELQYAQTGSAALCFPQSAIEVGRDASCAWTTTAAGGELVRFRQRVSLTQPGARVELAGVSALGGARQWHGWVRVDHLAGHTDSAQTYRVVADDAARASFDGRVGIAKGADGANARQLSKNLLLSRQARIDARPQLDILDDDVKASHGATIGQLAPDELFYLRARGLGEAEARALLVRGFVDVVAALHADPAVRARAAAILAR